MRTAIAASLLTALLAAVASAGTEQEVAQTLTQRLRTAFGEHRDLCGVHELRMTAAMTVAGDKRDLDLAIARQQLAADLAAAATVMAGADPQQQPPQLRAQYIQGIATAVQQFQQALGTAHQEWANATSQAFTRMQQDEAATLNTLQQGLSSASQSVVTGIQSIPADVAPDANFALPDLSGQANVPEALSGADKALAETRAKYREDLKDLLGTAYTELKAAVAIATPADRATAVRKAASKLRMVCLDRHDQYDSDVRTIVRKALLQATE
jgi:hypothetical protein